MDDGISSLSTDKLVECIRDTGDAQYAEELVHRLRPQLLRYCGRILGEKTGAEDVTQEALMRILAKLSLYWPGNFPAWAQTIARRCALNHMKTRLDAVELDSVIEKTPSGIDVEAVSVASQQRERVVDVLKLLPAPQRVCLKLLYVDQAPYAEIARQTGWPLRTVKSHIQNGRLQFEREWEKRYGRI